MTRAQLLTATLLLAATLGAFAGRRDEAGPIVGEFTPPKWYHKKDGPIFEIRQSIGEDVELRHYEPTKWISTNVTNTKFDDAYKEGTDRLDHYWKGDNQPAGADKGSKIDSTVPTVVLFYPTGTGQTVQSLFTVEYFLPHELHDAPPAPTSAELSVLPVEQQDVWVQVFGGFVGEKEIMSQAFGFIDVLKQQGVEVDETAIAVAFYDSPATLVGRHNEIWVWGKPAPTKTIISWLTTLRKWLTLGRP